MSDASASEVAANDGAGGQQRRRPFLLRCLSRPGSAPEAVPVIEPMVWSDEPEAAAGIISRFVYLWIQPLFTRARFLHQNGMALEQNDLPPLSNIDQGRPLSAAFEEGWARSVRRTEEKAQARKEEDGIAAKGSAKEKEKHSKSTKDLEKDELFKHLRSGLFAVMGRRLGIAGLVKVVNSLLQIFYPWLLRQVLLSVEKSQMGEEVVGSFGYWMAALLFLAMASKAITENYYFQLVYRAGFQSRVAVSASVYEKSLRLAAAERGTTSLGELVNLMQIDAAKIEMFIPQIHVLWDGMFQVIGYIAVLYLLIGWSSLIGMAVLLATGPLQGIIMKKLFGINRGMVKHTDQRVKTTNEAIMGMQAVKMYLWEKSFEKSINRSRLEELALLRRMSYLRGAGRSVITALPAIAAVISFITYASVSNGEVSASILFPALAAFDQLRFPLIFYPVALAQWAQAKVSADRVAAFLGMKEIACGDGHYLRNSETTGAGGEITVEHAKIYWSDPDVPLATVKRDEAEKATEKIAANVSIRPNLDDTDSESVSVDIFPKAILSDVSFQVGSGELCAVVGRVGSGKSSLCSAVLNEMVLAEGKVAVTGSIAYVAQTPWILNATLRDNVLFGLPMDEERYAAVLEAAQLTHDLSIFNDGDMTEIGERGINLSGGQKQRVSIARAAYSNANLIILDDPLSALDPKVGERVFNDCILGQMAGRSRLFVTNQLQFLRRCDSVILLGEGRVVEQGTYKDIMAVDKGEVKRLLSELKSAGSAEQNEDNTTGSKVTKEDSNDAATASGAQEDKKSEGKLTTKEERNVGAVTFDVYRKYIVRGGGGFLFCLSSLIFIAVGLIELGKNLVVSIWTADAFVGYQRHSIGFYMGMYALSAIALGIFTFLRVFGITRFGIRASKNLHNDLVASIMKAPMSFFDTTPTGRIISRFSKDIYSIDNETTESFDFFLWCLIYVIISFGVIIDATPWFAVSIPPLLYVYLKVLNYFRDVSRETKRIDSISRSPVYAHFSESLGGLSTIRAYGQPDRFIADFLGKLNTNTRAFATLKFADRWLSVRLELIGAIVSGLAAFLAIDAAVRNAKSDSPNNAFASKAGLSLVYAIGVTGLLNWLVRTFAQLEASMNATERILYYTDEIPQEAADTAAALQTHFAGDKSPSQSDSSAFAVAASGGTVEKVDAAWPKRGKITVKNLVMRYREETPVVLKGLNVSIEGGEKIGIVGRTGSGKSSLLLALMRLVEPELSGGKESYRAPIEIDGVDCLRIGLDELREKIAIIPQNPVLFSGTIRSNLDPFDKHSDEDIWSALTNCGMDKVVAESPDKLSASVVEYGENWSQGQRQMLCLGRALLRKCNILFLDEATSSVDFETDREIQRTIRDAFATSTVLTIAHRIDTILDSDKILVMDEGIAAEFGAPKELLNDKDSLFSDIVRNAKEGE